MAPSVSSCEQEEANGRVRDGWFASVATGNVAAGLSSDSAHFLLFFPAASGRNSANFSMAADQTASAPFWLVLWWLLLLPLGLISPHRLMYFS